MEGSFSFCRDFTNANVDWGTIVQKSFTVGATITKALLGETVHAFDPFWLQTYACRVPTTTMRLAQANTSETFLGVFRRRRANAICSRTCIEPVKHNHARNRWCLLFFSKVCSKFIYICNIRTLSLVRYTTFSTQGA